MKKTIKINKDEEERLDKYLSSHFNLSRSKIQKLIDKGSIRVNGELTKSSYLPRQDDLISLENHKEEISLEAKEMELDIVYEDEDIIIVNKDQDLIVHPSLHEQNNTLVNGLLAYTKSLGRKENSIRPGIVHRLDKDTSGLLLVAKTDLAYDRMVEAFSKSRVKREYLAILQGRLEGQGEIREPIGRNPRKRIQMAINYKHGKPAHSSYQVLENFGDLSLVKLRIYTGRTHQIRVHMAHLGFPVLGDSIYGRTNKYKIKKQMLHSYLIGFEHPTSGEYMEFERPLPERFMQLISRVKNEENNE